MSTETVVQLCGPLVVRIGGQMVELPGRQGRLVFAYLALHRARPVRRDELIDALWPRAAPASADATLISLLSRLRKALPAGVIAGRGQLSLLFDGSTDVEVAAAATGRAREALAAGDAHAALAAARAGLEIASAPLLGEFEGQWVDEHRRALVETELTLLELVARAAQAGGELAVGEAAARRLVEREPLRESASALLMELLAAGGDVAAALQVYETLRGRLRDELGTVPAQHVRELAEHLLTHQRAPERVPRPAAATTVGAALQAPAAPPAAAAPSPPADAAPPLAAALQAPAAPPAAAASSPPADAAPPLAAAPPPAALAPRLFGRDRDLAALTALLERSRLVTLTGPGGVGKTTLAAALAQRDASARFVELAPVAEPGFVAAAITDALGVGFDEGETAREALLRQLAGRRLLLVLDNFEQVLDAAPLVGELLAHCPELTVVCTSRAPLQLSAEQRYPVEPLALTEDAPALQLFCERARSRDPDFELTPANEDAVATICRRLGGLPLALELAAARIGFLSPQELAAGLDDALGLLVGGPRDRPDRHRTLRATLDWSYALLTDGEREAFAAFAVFSGGATIAAALEVTMADLATLESLSTGNLLTRSGGRLTMLEPVRAYAAERLGDAADVRRRHARWCLRLGETTFGDIAHLAGGKELAAFRAEAENVRAALAWTLGSGDGELALGLVCACGPWWPATSQLPEGRGYLREALELAGDDAPPPLLARALALRAALWGRLPGAIEGRVDDLTASLALGRELGDKRHVLFVLMRLGLAQFDLERPDRAIAAADEALALARELGDRTLISRALAIRAAAEPDHPEARERARQAVGPLLRDEEVTDALTLLINVGYVAVAEGRLTQARELFEEALALADSHRLRFYVHANLGLVHLLLGHDLEAADTLRQALEVARDGAVEEFDEPLLALAALAARNRELERAARLTGAGDAHTPAVLRHYEIRVDAILRNEYLLPAREQLGAQRWDELAALGARLGREDAIELGLQAATQPRAPAVVSPSAGG